MNVHPYSRPAAGRRYVPKSASGIDLVAVSRPTHLSIGYHMVTFDTLRNDSTWVRTRLTDAHHPSRNDARFSDLANLLDLTFPSLSNPSLTVTSYLAKSSRSRILRRCYASKGRRIQSRPSRYYFYLRPYPVASHYIANVSHCSSSSDIRDRSADARGGILYRQQSQFMHLIESLHGLQLLLAATTV